MSDTRQKALDFAHANQERFLEELKAYCAIASISTGTEHTAEIQQAD
jgi:hypothetical protein